MPGGSGYVETITYVFRSICRILIQRRKDIWTNQRALPVVPSIQGILEDVGQASY